MANTNQSAFQQNLRIDEYTLLQNIINKKMFINIGIITEVITPVLVNVKLYRTYPNSEPMEISAVRLIHLGTDKCRVFIQPVIGDNILLFANHDFISELEYNHEPNLDDNNFQPYDNCTMQGILISPEKADNDEDILTTVTVDENGGIKITEKNYENEITVNASGVEIKNKKNDIVIGDSGVDINGGNLTIAAM